MVCGFFRECSHGAAFVIGVFKAVEEHVIVDFAVAHAIAATRFFEQIGRVGHAFHAASNHNVRTSCGNEIGAQHDGLHARSANLVDGRAGHILREASMN
ncbi:hypothetical protein D3C80_901940 [compost metagenome]